jgi:hypothetical protein
VNVDGGPVRITAHFGDSPGGIVVPLGELSGYCRFPISLSEEPLSVLAENVGDLPATVVVVGLSTRVRDADRNATS